MDDVNPVTDTFWKLLLRSALLVFAVLWSSACCTPASKEFDFGFIASRQRDVLGNMRFKAAGPFYEYSLSTSNDIFMAARPVFSRTDVSLAERRLTEILWPVASLRRIEKQISQRYVLVYYQKEDVSKPESRYRFFLFPLYFQGRDAKGIRYAAIVPLGGTIRDNLLSDEINFFLFPLYWDRTVNGVKTVNVVWPIYSKTDRQGEDRHMVFPIYGYSRHEDEFEKKFIMWPIYTWANYNYKASKGSGHIVFPLYGYVNLTDQRTVWIVPPFFRFTRGARQNKIFCPWPFVQIMRGEVDKLYIWPLWGRKYQSGRRSSFFLWPLGRTSHSDRLDKTVRNQFKFIPFVDSYVDRNNRLPKTNPESVKSRYHKLWPLASYVQRGDFSRFRFLELNPLRKTGAIERNYAPFWTLYTHQRKGEAKESEFLWGLYRNKCKGEERRYVSLFPLCSYERDDSEDNSKREWSFLKGLVGYKREDDEKYVRLLYLIKIPLSQEK